MDRDKFVERRMRVGMNILQLLVNEPMTERDLWNVLDLPWQTVRSILKRLESKGSVEVLAGPKRVPRGDWIYRLTIPDPSQILTREVEKLYEFKELRWDGIMCVKLCGRVDWLVDSYALIVKMYNKFVRACDTAMLRELRIRMESALSDN